MRPPLQTVGPTDPRRFPTMSDRDYLTLIEDIPGVSYRCLPIVTWPMIFISDEVERLTGWPAEDFIGLEPKRNYISIIHPDDQQMVSDVIFEAVNERRPYTIEYRVVTNEGKLRWVLERGLAIHEESGDAAYLDGTILDVTARKNAELELAKYRGHLEELVAKRTSSLEDEVAAHQRAAQDLAEKSRDLDDFFNRSTDLLVIIGADRLLKRVSPSLVTTLGAKDASEVIGHEANEFIHEDDAEAAKRAMADTLKNGKSGHIDCRIRHHDGKYLNVEWKAYAAGRQLYIVGRDVTERLEMQRTLKDNEEQFRVIFRQSPIGMALLSRPDMKCVDINEIMLTLIGMTREQCLGRTPLSVDFFVTQKDIDEAEEICTKGLAKRNEPMEYRRADGTVLNIVLSCEPLRTSKGEFMLIFCSIADAATEGK
jgi:PAS domain S-box-containing protein